MHCAGLKDREQTGAPGGGRQTERLTMCAARWEREEAAHRDRKRHRETGNCTERPEAARKDQTERPEEDVLSETVNVTTGLPVADWPG